MYQYGSLKPGFIPESFDGSTLVGFNTLGPAHAQAFAGPRSAKFTVSGPLIGAIMTSYSFPTTNRSRGSSAPRSVDK